MTPYGGTLLFREMRKLYYGKIADAVIKKFKLKGKIDRDAILIAIKDIFTEYIIEMKDDLINEAKEVVIGKTLKLQIKNIDPKSYKYKYIAKNDGNAYRLYPTVSDSYYMQKRRLYNAYLRRDMYKQLREKIDSGMTYPYNDASRIVKLKQKIKQYEQQRIYKLQGDSKKYSIKTQT